MQPQAAFQGRDIVEAVKKTPLHDVHEELGARMVDFAGWAMPMQYRKGINEEHLAVRTGTGIFDVSHMGQVSVGGPQAVEFLRYCALNDAGRLRPMRAHYSMLANDSGGLVDDIYVYRLADDQFMLATNAANREAAVQHLKKLAANFDVTLSDDSDDWALLALQGPGAAVMLERAARADLTGVRKNGLMWLDVYGQRVLAARTGYTGEDGFELFCEPAGVQEVWRGLLSAGAEPCGLGARDTLRLEAGFPLFGNELTETSNPLCTPFGWVVKDKDFYGRERLWNPECPRRLVGFRLLQRGVARKGYRLFQGEQQIGEVTSGTISPVTREGIAMGWVDRQLATSGQSLSVEIRGQPVPATIVDLPFTEG